MSVFGVVHVHLRRLVCRTRTPVCLPLSLWSFCVLTCFTFMLFVELELLWAYLCHSLWSFYVLTCFTFIQFVELELLWAYLCHPLWSFCVFTCFMQFVELNSLCGHIVQWFAYTVTVLCDCLRHVVCLYFCVVTFVMWFVYFSMWSPLSCGLFNIFLCGHLCCVKNK